MRLADAEAQRKIVNRLRRARGQLDALIKAVEDDSNCRDVVIQLAAVSKALDRAGFVIVSTAMRECITPATDEEEPQMTPEELEKLFMMLS